MSFKKTLCSLLTGAFLLANSSPVFSKNYNYADPIGNLISKQEKKEDSIIPWLWLGGNALLAGATTYFTIDALKAKDAYEKNLALYDNTTLEWYNKLVNEKKSAENKLNLALGLGIGTGISTLANIIFWNAFNEQKDKKFTM